MQVKQSSIAISFLRAATLLLCTGLLLCPLESNASEQKLERVKIAFVYKFLSLIEWHNETDESASRELVIGVAGSKGLVRNFSVLTGKFIRAHQVSIKSIGKRGRGVEGINVLYISQSHQKASIQLLAAPGDGPVLTIAEGSRDILQSTMIVLYEHEGYVRFDINNTLARSKGIKLNAKLLELAGKVI